ncbi:MAG TPA: collagenase-like protease [Candidatus Marinimicrobia bacterium]|nr:collagenase-like protease [Candidatus Neomarinimicrobiota bacterium]
MTRKDIELMAPVGSYESLQAAIQGGAEAVYFGVEKLNMRSRSSKNFTLADLKKIVEIAAEKGIKTYLTLNTVMYNRDLDILRGIVDAAKQSGVDAIIASDPAVFDYVQKQGMSVHLSTQANVSNIESVRYYSRIADVIVLARELTLDQVEEISEAIQKEQITGPSGELIRIEMFVHGALCMAISGKCYLSLHQANYSANRGACLQICRRSYTARDTETGDELEIDNEYIMSPKDLLTIHFLDKILAAGVTVLKIEGRARSPEYVYTVTQCYSEAVNSILAGTYSKEKIDGWVERLKTVFNRGFWDGYYLGQRLGEWSKRYGSQATRKKVYIGKGINYFQKIKIAEFLIETKSLKVGDRILVTGPTTGIIESEIKEIRIDDKSVSQAIKGEYCTIPLESTIRQSDKLYKITDLK